MDVAPRDKSGKFTRRVTMPENGLPDAAADLQRFRRFEEKLAPAAREKWRWRQLMIRAEVDAELAKGNGEISEKLDALFEELERMYRIDPARAFARVAPPTKAFLSLTV